MKKSNLVFFSFVLFSALILVSCNGKDKTEILLSETENPDVGDVATELPAVEATEPLALITSEPPVTTAEVTGETQSPPSPQELPDIPLIEYGPGDAWFRPTDPSQIQLASGKVQVFKFSASW